MKNQKAAFLPVVLMVFSVSFAQHTGWTQYTNGNCIAALAESGNDIWVGTNGGGLVKINKTTGLTTFYNTANSGLPNNYVSAIAIDAIGADK